VRQDCIEQGKILSKKVWDEVRLKLELQPEITAKAIIFWLMEKYPEQYETLHIRTMQRRIKQWRQDQASQEVQMREIMMNSVDNQEGSFNVSLTNEGDLNYRKVS
jgi:hypothetical protein